VKICDSHTYAYYNNLLYPAQKNDIIIAIKLAGSVTLTIDRLNQVSGVPTPREYNMRVGKELIGKPIYSVTDGKQLGVVKDVYLDKDIKILNGLFIGQEGLFNRKSNLIARENIAVLGLDAVLTSSSDIVTDSNVFPEVESWLRREDIQGREIETAGGTKVGTVGDVLFDEEAKIIGFTLSRVNVEGPIAENKKVLKEAVTDAGGVDGVVIVDLAKAEKPSTQDEVGASKTTDIDGNEALQVENQIEEKPESKAENPTS
jgi:uncharacterized protein YrrD